MCVFTWSTSLGLTNDPLLSLSFTCKVINNKVKSQSFMYEPKWPLSLLWSPHSTLRNRLPQHQVLQSNQHCQLTTLHCFQFLHQLPFKFPPLTIIMVNHIIIDIIWSQLMSLEAVPRNQTTVPDLLLYPCTSPIDDEHDEHHMSKRDMHFGKYRLGLPLQDIHLCQIWNLRTRMGVMLWSLISSGTGTISSSQTLFLFSIALCASSIIFLCHCA